MKKIPVILIMIILIFCCSPVKPGCIEQDKKFIILPGSNIYVRIFMFYFPLAKNYEVFFNFQKDFFDLEIFIEKDDIINEPSTPSYFTSDLIFRIKNIPYNVKEELNLQVTIQCNKKFIHKEADFTIYQDDNVFIINGDINNLIIKDITDDEYFKNRMKWKLPYYFDIRLLVDEQMLEERFFKQNN